MAHSEEVIMPRLDMTSEQMTILRWLKSEGEFVEKGEPLLEVMTEKITIEIEAPVSGYVHVLLYGVDDVVPVGEVIARIGDEPGEKPAADGETANTLSPDGSAGKELVRAAPVVRRIAADLGVDLGQVVGTGPGGRVLAEDVRAFAEAGQGIAAFAVRQEVETVGEGKGKAGGERPAEREDRTYTETRLSPLRRTIAARMEGSWREAPHVTLAIDVDMSAAAAFRERLRAAMAAEGSSVSLTWNSFIAWVAVQALVRRPELNGTMEGDRLRRYDDVHLGVAVDAPSGLVVPVVENAQRLSPSQLSVAISDKVERALVGTLQPDDVHGGTFTVTNLGGFGIRSFTPIINPPQIAILGVGAVEERVVPVDGQPVVRPVCTFSLSLDHRALDGADGARYLALLKEILLDPHRLVV